MPRPTWKLKRQLIYFTCRQRIHEWDHHWVYQQVRIWHQLYLLKPRSPTYLPVSQSPQSRTTGWAGCPLSHLWWQVYKRRVKGKMLCRDLIPRSVLKTKGWSDGLRGNEFIFRNPKVRGSTPPLGTLGNCVWKPLPRVDPSLVRKYGQMTRRSLKSAFAVRRCALAGLHRYGVWLHKLLELTCRVEYDNNKNNDKITKKKEKERKRKE